MRKFPVSNPPEERPKPTVLDQWGERRLYFGKRYIQSAMRLDDHYALVLPYTRYMMASLLFVPRPERVLITGLGGGSLPRFCHRYMPEARISVVEISEEVIGLRSQFPLPEDDRLTIIQGDAMDFLASNRQQFDIVLLDAYQADGLPSGLVTPQFGRYTAAAVGANGVLIANLTGDSTRWNSHLRQLWAAFDRRIRVLPVPEEEGQYLALGFHAPELYRIPEQIEAHADALQQSTPLDFSALSSWVRGEGLEW